MLKFDRRRFLTTSAAGLGVLATGRMPEVWGQEKKPRSKLPVAGICTSYSNNTHADVIFGKILEGFEQDGGPGPDLELVSLYTDQTPKNDLSRELAKKHGFRIANTIEEAVTVGQNKIPVAGVIIVGEHGDYPSVPETGQKMYPRRRFFEQTAAAFQKYDRVVPVFSDKHLSYNWSDAKKMYDKAQELDIPFMAGSSLPVAWRSPGVVMPMGSELTGAMGIGYGGRESYGFHALEGLQCMVERRRGGETGVVSVQAAEGNAIEMAEKAGLWSRDLMMAAAEVTPPPHKTRPRMLNDRAFLYMIEYADGLRAGIMMCGSLTHHFGFAAQMKSQEKPIATWFELQEVKPYGHFAFLLQAIDEMIHTGKPAYPVERTLLTTGVLDAALHSLADNGRRIATPQLAIKYAPVDWPYAKTVRPSLR